MRSAFPIFVMLAFLASCIPNASDYLDAGARVEETDADGLDCEALNDIDPTLIIVECGSECVSLVNDVDNCGACGRACDRKYSNACNDGSCGCGEGRPCAAPAECASSEGISFCLVADTSGEFCDVDVQCQDGKVCIGGHCTVPVGIPEICDGWDNDLDGSVDENDLGAPISEFCYTGPVGTEDIGECHGGVSICESGVMTQCNDSTPKPETGLLTCDGVDNDCDGCADGDLDMGTCVSTDPLYIDIPLIIDTSGSMTDDIVATVSSTLMFGSAFSGSLYIWFGIMEISMGDDNLIEITQPLAEFSIFETTLSATTADGGGTEPTYDAVYRLATGYYDVMDSADPRYMGFRTDSLRIYIVFTDESAQTMLSLTETEVCDAVNAQGAVLAVFTDPMFFGDWDECAILYELSDDVSAMKDNLDDLFETPCTSGP